MAGRGDERMNNKEFETINTADIPGRTWGKYRQTFKDCSSEMIAGTSRVYGRERMKYAVISMRYFHRKNTFMDLKATNVRDRVYIIKK